MKRKKWPSKKKWMVVVEGLKGRKVAELCVEYGITQSQYYAWRDQFLSEGYKVFDQTKTDQKQATLERQNAKLKKIIGELTVELKKNDEWYE